MLWLLFFVLLPVATNAQTCTGDQRLIENLCQCDPLATPAANSTCDCPALYFMDNATCQACPEGYWSNPGARACSLFQGININVEFDADASLNISALPYDATVDQVVVMTESCPAGYYCPEDTLVPCPAGTYSNTLGASTIDTCLTCDPGTYCPTASSAQIHCAPGTHQPNAGASQCLECPVASYCPYGAVNASACPAGTFSNTPGLANASQCQACAAGTYTAVPNNTECQVCPAGYYCTQGTFDPTLCPLGYVRLQVGGASLSDCLVCPNGSYCPSRTTVQSCTAGTYQPNEGVSTGCMQCDISTYSLDIGRSSQCPPCSAGSYCSSPTTISACPNHTDSDSGAYSQLQCRCLAGFHCQYTKHVQLVVILQVSLEDFENNINGVRTNFINTLASAANVSPSQIIILSVTYKARRGLHVRASIASPTRMNKRALADNVGGSQFSFRSSVTVGAHAAVASPYLLPPPPPALPSARRLR